MLRDYLRCLFRVRLDELVAAVVGQKQLPDGLRVGFRKLSVCYYDKQSFLDTGAVYENFAVRGLKLK